MNRGQEGTPGTPRKLKFAPKVPVRKSPKRAAAKAELSVTKDDVIDKELLSKIQKMKGVDRRFVNSDKKVAQTEVVFGHAKSTLARSYPKAKAEVNESQESSDEPFLKPKKDYVEPWDYANSYYPVSLPLRRPYSGDPEILNEEEFGEASASAALDESRINPAEALGLVEKREDLQMLFFQFPTTLPLVKTPLTGGAKHTCGKREHRYMKGCRLEDIPEGLIGKMMVYKSGKVKMKLGNVLFDISPGSKCEFAQDIAAINIKEKHCCTLGEPCKRAVATPDVDSLLDSMDDWLSVDAAISVVDYDEGCCK